MQPKYNIFRKNACDRLTTLHGFSSFHNLSSALKLPLNVNCMQRSGTDEIKTQIQPSKPKREITEITNSQNTKRKYSQPSEQLFPKRWPLSNPNRTKNNMNTRKVKRHRNTGTKNSHNEAQMDCIVGRTGAVISAADYGPRGPWFETWPPHSLLWP